MKLLPPRVPIDLPNLSDAEEAFLDDEVDVAEALVENVTACMAANTAELDESRMQSCDLSQSKVGRLHIRDCVMQETSLTACSFSRSQWQRVAVVGSRCSGIQLSESNLKQCHFKNSKLDLANFRFAQLDNVVFESCIVKGLDLYGATVRNVEFIDCVIDDIEFSNATFHNVDLSRSSIVALHGLRYLKGVTISNEQLLQISGALAAEIGIRVT